MHRAQILLEEWQFEMLKAKAQREGKSVSELVREILAEAFGARRPSASKRGLSGIAGIVRDPGLSGRDHDEVLYGPRRK
jgi:hypothetical protein